MCGAAVLCRMPARGLADYICGLHIRQVRRGGGSGRRGVVGECGMLDQLVIHQLSINDFDQS